MNLNTQIKSLFSEQTANWELARRNYEGLKRLQTKTFDFGEFAVQVQFNPSRIRSTAAKTDDKSIAERICFLCAENRPKEQKFIFWSNYEILLNPYPVFPEHFTIVHREHRRQQILPFFADLLLLSKELSDYTVFYNGACCGASAPDHLHFQAGTKDFLPLLKDYKCLETKELLTNRENYKIYELKNYLRRVFCVEILVSTRMTQIIQMLTDFFIQNNIDEMMINVICYYTENQWFIFIFPRKAFRPFQYFSANETERLLVSPAAVELSGVIVTPREEDFLKIRKEDIVSIYKQVS
ncbi:MAG: DUF4922 domain-containing protein [Paludibacter sp.]|jgi:hypothetical protein|nr:DUF4922 domain-containing protein [Paludibacter sp.]